ncbi:hypothetical protein CHS0354_040654 [Potamilus streckersoni]|uniref:Uncharacterized protein n=1 Tax=Potamilus streckersoni TaxID=2493646 RepID=A0AAE0TCB7_9BIVA|nr:hypothetical protein CHS0354_040654 [Potamilus streckersoni]
MNKGYLINNGLHSRLEDTAMWHEKDHVHCSICLITSRTAMEKQSLLTIYNKDRSVRIMDNCLIRLHFYLWGSGNITEKMNAKLISIKYLKVFHYISLIMIR